MRTTLWHFGKHTKKLSQFNNNVKQKDNLIPLSKWKEHFSQQMNTND